MNWIVIEVDFFLIINQSFMFKTLSVFISVLIVFLSCKTTKNSSDTKSANLNVPDSFRPADLFFLSPEKQLLYYQNAEKILPTNKIEAGKKKYPLRKSLRDLSGFSFKYKDTVRTIEDFIRTTRAVGIMIVRNDTILYERYEQGNNAATKWIDFSVAKSITSLLFGAAMQDGYIKSLDDLVPKYIPELANTVYDSVTLKNLLQMHSGVAWNDDTRSPQSDLMKVGRLEKENGWNAVVEYLSKLKRVAPPGRRFNYNTIETSLMGLILSRAIGKTLSQYLSEKVWKPFGMHDDANWIRSRVNNIEIGGCCVSATLMDHALLGLYAMNNGIGLDGKPQLPENWIKESITPTRSYKGYGYYWWLHPGRYFASGAFGQQVEIDPATRTVVAIHSYWPIAFHDYYIDYIDGFIAEVIKYVNANTKAN